MWFHTEFERLAKRTDDTLSPSTIGIHVFYNSQEKYQYQLLNAPKIYDGFQGTNFENLLCFWCSHTTPPEWEPVYLPFKKDVRGRVYTKGYFCSFNCAKAYANSENINPTLLWSLYKSLNRSIDLNTGKTTKFPDRIKSASDWRTLKAFGGIQTIEEFRKDFQNLSKKIEYTEFPIVHEIAQFRVTEIQRITEKKEKFQVEDLPDEIVNPFAKKKGRKPKVVKTIKNSTIGIVSSFLK